MTVLQYLGVALLLGLVWSLTDSLPNRQRKGKLAMRSKTAIVAPNANYLSVMIRRACSRTFWMTDFDYKPRITVGLFIPSLHGFNLPSMEYVNKPHSRLVCPICQDVFTDPLISVICHHTFCTKCVGESLRVESQCPLCRKYLTSNGITACDLLLYHISFTTVSPQTADLHSNLVLKSMCDELPAFCANKVLGCSTTAPREAIATHQTSCEFRFAKCENAVLGCAFEGSSVAVARHVASDCIYQTLAPYIQANELRVATLEALVESQASEIAKLKKQIAAGSTVPSSQFLEDEEEIILPKTAAFPHGQNIECRRTISDNKTGVTSLAYTSQNTLLSGAYDGSIRLFNVDTGKMTRSITSAHDLSVWAIATEEATGRFFSAGDGKIKVWELEGENSCLKTLNDNQLKVYSLAISNGRLYSASSDGKIKVWSTENLECETTIQAHSDCINSLVLLDNDPTKLASVSSDRTLKLWDLTTGSLIHTFSDLGSEGLDVSSGGGMLYASTFDASIVAFEMDAYSRTRTLRGHNWEVWQVKYCDGVLFSGSFDHTIKRWDLKTFESDLTLKGHKGYVHSFRFGNDCLISAGADKTIKIWK
ncbi:WD40-repeat-containing domain protein [Chytriomyces sp. MP71]|nr:WD40-repeat-containing domain protein [Chytriomyces sp. MP71]